MGLEQFGRARSEARAKKALSRSACTGTLATPQAICELNINPLEDAKIWTYFLLRAQIFGEH